MSDTLLIPSAAFVPDELKLDLGPVPTGMIPLHGQPTIEHIADSYEEFSGSSGLTRVVACPADDKTIQNWVDTSAYEWETVDIADSQTLGQTVYQSLAAIDTHTQGDGDLYIQFADTIVHPPWYASSTDRITFDRVDHPVRWTTFDRNDAGTIGSVFEKFSDFRNKPENTFVGHFQISHMSDFEQLLQEVCSAEMPDKSPLDPFYRALLSYLDGREYELVEPDEWIDVGHLDTYHRAKTDFLNIRGFNQITIDNERNVLRKQSSNADILNAEISWYQNLPKALKPYVPRILDYSTSDDPFVELEYIGYPSVSDIYMYGNHGLHIWNSIFSSIFDIVDKFREYQPKNGNQITDAVSDMYLGKTQRRLDRAAKHSDLRPFFDVERVRINGTAHESVSTILSSLENELSEFGLLDPVVPSVIHGDMCFANILCDVRSGIVKLIDPRGAFGEYDIYGDYRYDLAKLTHSISGKYEFIINDRFEIEVDDGAVNYTIYTENQHEQREELFHSLLESQYPDIAKDIDAIECLLWLSMVPLHNDAPDRQQVMLAQGIEKYNEIFLD